MNLVYILEIKRGSGFTEYYDREIIPQSFDSQQEAVEWIKINPSIESREDPKNSWWWFCLSEFDTKKSVKIKISKLQKAGNRIASLISKNFSRDLSSSTSIHNEPEIMKLNNKYCYDWDGNLIEKEPINGYK